MRAIGVETEGSNVQFAVHPRTGQRVVIEMNPRVSRSSALASKATGFPIAKIAAKLAVGYSLDEITNDITRLTPASFEPSIDYVVVKIPRWTFEKFPGADERLGTKMKSVGEVMAIGRTFAEALQKGFRSLERDLHGLSGAGVALDGATSLGIPTEVRLRQVEAALYGGMSAETAAETSGIDVWFIGQIARIAAARRAAEEASSLESLDADDLRALKRMGFSDAQIGTFINADELAVRTRRIFRGFR